MATTVEKVKIDDDTEVRTVKAETAKGNHYVISIENEDGEEHLTVHTDGQVNFTNRDGERSSYDRD